MDARMFGLETPLMVALQHLLDVPDGDAGAGGDKAGAAAGGPTRTYVRDARAMAATPADVKELGVLLVRGGHAGAGHKRHQGAGGGRAGAGDQRRAAPGGARGRQVPAHGAPDGQVHAQVRAPGQRRHGQDLCRLQGRCAHGDRGEAAAAGAQEATIEVKIA